MNGFAVDVPRRIQRPNHNHPNHNHALQLGNSLTSTMNVGRDQLLSVISFHRGRNDRRPFNQRDRRVVRLFHSQMEWMFDNQLPSESASTFDSLTPRQQQTLRCLLSGDSEKQIANKLARSPHTVHTHVKSIYRNLGVSSRGECSHCLCDDSMLKAQDQAVSLKMGISGRQSKRTRIRKPTPRLT